MKRRDALERARRSGSLVSLSHVDFTSRRSPRDRGGSGFSALLRRGSRRITRQYASDDNAECPPSGRSSISSIVLAVRRLGSRSVSVAEEPAVTEEGQTGTELVVPAPTRNRLAVSNPQLDNLVFQVII